MTVLAQVRPWLARPEALLAVAVALAVVAVAAVVPPAERTVIYGALPALAGAGILAGVQRHRPVQAAGWTLLGLGLGVIAIGHLLALVPHAPSAITPGTGPTLIGYGCIVVAALRLARSNGLRDDIAILDAAIMASGLVLIVWDLVIKPVTGGVSAVDAATTVLAVTYPVADLLVVAILLRLVIVEPALRVGSGALVAAFGLLGLADGQTSADIIRGAVISSDVQHLVGLVAYGLIAAVGLDGRFARLGAEQQQPSPWRDHIRTLGVSSAILVPPIVLLGLAESGSVADRWFATVASLLIAVLVVTRLHRTIASLIRSQLEFRQFTAYPGLLAVIKDELGRYRFMSDKAVTNNRLGDGAWYGRTDAELFDQETVSIRTELDARVRRSGETEIRLDEIAGATWHTEKFVLRDLPGWIGIIGVDITERVRADHRREELEQQLAATDRAIAKDTQRRAAERRLVRDALRELRASDSPEATAEVVCRAIAAVPEFSHGVVLAFDGTGGCEVLALVDREQRLVESRPIPAPRAAYLRERASRGPWVERWLNDRVHPYQDLIQGLQIAAHAYAPIVADDRLIGLIVVGSGDPGAMVRLTEWLPGLAEFAQIGGALLAPALAARSTRADAVAAMRRVVDGCQFRPVFQPIVDLRSGAALGFEALTRFDDGTPPDQAFQAAHALGVGDVLELESLRLALEAARALPSEAWLNVNVSPAIIGRPELADLLGSTDRELVVEITEHDEVADYAAFRAAFATLEGRVKLCVDDAGSGFASLRHVVELGPAFVKLDRSLVAGIDHDPARQAAVAGLIHYASVAGVRLVAEGIEEPGELEVLRSLGIVLGQGYLLGRPAPVASGSASESLPRLSRRSGSPPSSSTRRAA
ncbi:MAG TPA: EAL domain-containing protein [Candidatus Limnocylindrales bacterium]